VTMPKDRVPTERMLLKARASIARRLVRDGLLDADVALAFAVWPTPAIREREQHVGYGTLGNRAFSQRENP